MSDVTDPIRCRALRFAETFDWINPVIDDGRPANPEIVTRFGNGVVEDYREFTVEMQWSQSQRENIIRNAKGGDAVDVERFLAGSMIIRITCNATDVIAHEFPGVDLD